MISSNSKPMTTSLLSVNCFCPDRVELEDLHYPYRIEAEAIEKVQWKSAG